MGEERERMHQGQVFSHVTFVPGLSVWLSAQCAGMIGPWPAENGLTSFTYIHISLPLSCCVCVCVSNMQIGSSNAFDLVHVLVSVHMCTGAIVQHPDVSTASLSVCH